MHLSLVNLLERIYGERTGLIEFNIKQVEDIMKGVLVKLKQKYSDYKDDRLILDFEKMDGRWAIEPFSVEIYNPQTKENKEIEIGVYISSTESAGADYSPIKSRVTLYFSPTKITTSDKKFLKTMTPILGHEVSHSLDIGLEKYYKKQVKRMRAGKSASSPRSPRKDGYRDYVSSEFETKSFMRETWQEIRQQIKENPMILDVIETLRPEDLLQFSPRYQEIQKHLDKKAQKKMYQMVYNMWNILQKNKKVPNF